MARRTLYTFGPGGVRRGKIWTSGRGGRVAPVAVYSSGTITADKAGPAVWFYAAGVNFIANPLQNQNAKSIQAQRLAYINETDESIEINVAKNGKAFRINNPVTGKVTTVKLTLQARTFENIGWTPYQPALRNIYGGTGGNNVAARYWDNLDESVTYGDAFAFPFPWMLEDIEEYSILMTLRGSSGFESVVPVSVLICRKLTAADGRKFYNVLLLKRIASDLHT